MAQRECSTIHRQEEGGRDLALWATEALSRATTPTLEILPSGENERSREPQQMTLYVATTHLTREDVGVDGHGVLLGDRVICR